MFKDKFDELKLPAALRSVDLDSQLEAREAIGSWLANGYFLQSGLSLPVQHRNGFYKFPVAMAANGAKLAVHVWPSADLPGVAEDPHTHRWNFTSHVLVGRLSERIYEERSGTQEFTEYSCGSSDSTKALQINRQGVSLEVVGETQIAAGVHYSRTSGLIHSVAKDCTGPAMTLIFREQPDLAQSRVFRPPTTTFSDVPHVYHDADTWKVIGRDLAVSLSCD